MTHMSLFADMLATRLRVSYESDIQKMLAVLETEKEVLETTEEMLETTTEMQETTKEVLEKEIGHACLAQVTWVRPHFGERDVWVFLADSLLQAATFESSSSDGTINRISCVSGLTR